MSLSRFLSYPVYYDPGSVRASAYAMEHFYRIRSATRSRRLLKLLVRPFLPLMKRGGKDFLAVHPRFRRLRPFLEEGRFEVVIDARRFFRLIDFRRREVLNVFKDDDLTEYFENELAARSLLPEANFLPRLISSDRERKIFVEEYVCQYPLKSSRRGSLDLDELAVRIRELLRRVRRALPARAVAAEDYVGEISEAILRRPEADEAIRRYVVGLGRTARGLGRVELVFSHGDFRQDQIFFDRAGDLKVIDWECSGRFSRFWDPAALYLTERWFYGRPGLAPGFFLEPGPAPLEAVFALYLLELCHFPIRFRRDFLLTDSVPVVRKVERRIRKLVPGREGNP